MESEEFNRGKRPKFNIGSAEVISVFHGYKGVGFGVTISFSKQNSGQFTFVRPSPFGWMDTKRSFFEIFSIETVHLPWWVPRQRDIRVFLDCWQPR